LSAELSIQGMDAGVVSLDGEVTVLTQGADGWEVKTEGDRYSATNVVIASGARLRRLGIPGEEEFLGRGVSECADCDGPLYHGKAAVVVGGGDSAFQEAVALTSYCSAVTIAMRGTQPRARADLVNAVAAHPAITLLPETEVVEITGDASGMTGVHLAGAGAPSPTLDCAVIFMFVGLAPDVAYVPADIARDAQGGILADESGRTGLPGLWVVGAARSGFGGMLDDAATDAQRLVASL
jgi:thioredoxin reductase (NADPH)